MKKIFWRVFVYFGLVLLLFSVLIGLMFTRFNSTNIVGAYKQQLGDLATGVASRTSKAVSNKENDTFSDYLAAVEDFSDMQNVDIWVVSNEKAKNPLADDFTNVDIAQVTVPEDTRQILESAYQGKKKTYTDYDDIYKNTMLHLAVPIRDAGGNVIGAVVVTGPMEMQENTMTQYEKYMVLCVAVGTVSYLDPCGCIFQDAGAAHHQDQRGGTGAGGRRVWQKDRRNKTGRIRFAGGKHGYAVRPAGGGRRIPESGGAEPEGLFLKCVS